MSALLKPLWSATFGRVYDRLIRRYFTAILSRLDELLARWAEVRALTERFDQLDAHVRAVVAARWENEALARRIAMLEDRLGVNGASASTVEAEEKAEEG
jgi:BMFP domain-containing protein YqiC